MLCIAPTHGLSVSHPQIFQTSLQVLELLEEALPLLYNIWSLACDAVQLFISIPSHELRREDVRKIAKKMTFNDLATNIIDERLSGAGEPD